MVQNKNKELKIIQIIQEWGTQSGSKNTRMKNSTWLKKYKNWEHQIIQTVWK